MSGQGPDDPKLSPWTPAPLFIFSVPAQPKGHGHMVSAGPLGRTSRPHPQRTAEWTLPWLWGWTCSCNSMASIWELAGKED